MATLAPVLKHQFLDSSGVPLVGGKLYSYLAGTTTLAATYADASGTSNPNPIILDSAGWASIWLPSGTFKFVLYDANDALVWSEDNVTAVGGSSTISENTWLSHAVTDGQSATALAGQTVNSASYKSAIYQYVIKRGTTVFSSGWFALHYRNSAWELVLEGDGMADAAAAHGVTFSLTGTTTAQLNAALDTGAGNGTIDLKRTLVPA